MGETGSGLVGQCQVCEEETEEEEEEEVACRRDHAEAAWRG